MIPNIARLAATLLLVAAACNATFGAPPDGENAATYYRKAFEILPDKNDPNFSVLANPDAVHLDATAVQFIQKYDPAFEQLRKGAACLRCDWGVDPKQGTAAQLPHLEPARTLSNLTRLRARLLFQQRRHTEAMDDVVALLTLSRHVGSDSFIIAKLMEAGIADSGVAAAASGVVGLPPDAARALMEKLERLPNSMPVAEVVRREGQSIVSEVRESKSMTAAARDALAAEVARLYAEVEQHLALPFEQSFAPVQTWEKKRQAASPAAQKLVPSLRTCRVAVAAAETRVQMLFVAAAVRVDGRREVHRFNEPHAKGPFAYREIPGGFELESKLVVNNLPLTLTCGPSDDEVPF